MAKKGRKTKDFVEYGNRPVQDVINGSVVGLSFAPQNSTYYTMIPNQGRKWLGRDKDNAVIKFNALVNQLKGQQEKSYPVITDNKEITPVYTTPKRSMQDVLNSPDISLSKTEQSLINHPESHYIEWLKKELQNPSELAKKTGIEAFNNFWDCVNKKPIKILDAYNNYINSVKYAKITDKDEKEKIKSAWKLFTSLLNGKTHLEEISLDDIKRYEKKLHTTKYKDKKTGEQKNYNDKTINHYKNRVSKIIRHNLKLYEDTTTLQKILEYFKKWDDLEIASVNSINAECISYAEFTTLYENADLQLKAVMMFCLNTATYLREVSRIKLSDINFKTQTLMTQRNKTGRCRKFAFLWDRTTQALKDYLETRNDTTDILFVAAHGAGYKNGEGLRSRFWDLRKKCNLLSLEFQHLRDTFETIGNEIEVNKYHIDMVMGHSSGTMGERYSHRRIHNELKESCLKVEQAFFEESK